MNNKDCFCPFDEDLAREIFKKQDKQIQELKAKLEKIKSLCQEPNEPYYNPECEFGQGRSDLGQEVLGIIEGAEDE